MSFESISLSEMDNVSLMKRTDTKFVLNKTQLLRILSEVQSEYKVLEIDKTRLMSYHTHYYDTPDFEFYFKHHNDIAYRTKVRSRTYLDSNLTFLEIKQKDIKGRTIKSRIKTTNTSTNLNGVETNFINNTTSKNYTLKKSLTNSFNRFTLVSKYEKERVTVDSNLSYDRKMFNSELIVVELKQERLNRNSKVFQSLKRQGIHSMGLSKYCIGVSSENPHIKSNNFKRKFLAINKITN